MSFTLQQNLQRIKHSVMSSIYYTNTNRGGWHVAEIKNVVQGSYLKCSPAVCSCNSTSSTCEGQDGLSTRTDQYNWSISRAYVINVMTPSISLNDTLAVDLPFQTLVVDFSSNL